MNVNPYQASATDLTDVGSGNRRAKTLFVAYVILGPLVGVLIGFTQTLIGISVYCLYGQPVGFYFRGLYAATELLILLSIGGGFVGTIFGLLVVVGLAASKRSVNVARTHAAVLVVVSFASLAITVCEFQTRTVLPWVHQSTAIAIALITICYNSFPVGTAQEELGADTIA